MGLWGLQELPHKFGECGRTSGEKNFPMVVPHNKYLAGNPQKKTGEKCSTQLSITTLTHLKQDPISVVNVRIGWLPSGHLYHNTPYTPGVTLQVIPPPTSGSKITSIMTRTKGQISREFVWKLVRFLTFCRVVAVHGQLLVPCKKGSLPACKICGGPQV